MTESLQDRDPFVERLKKEISTNSDFLQYLEVLTETLRPEGERTVRTLMGHTGRSAGGPLQVQHVDCHIKQNTRSHTTDMFKLTQNRNAMLVVRRGAPVTFSVKFNRNYNGRKDRVLLILSSGQSPSEEDGSLIRLEVPRAKGSFFENDTSPWSISLVLADNRSVTLKVMLPSTTAAGLWNLNVETGWRASDMSSDSLLSETSATFYVLFNPWCPDDTVYLDDQAMIREYVLADTGKIYQGTWDYPSGKRWYFGQFEDVVLPACNYLLELGGMTATDRASPVAVARVIAAVANYNDDYGVLVGSWDDYSDGVSPLSWSSSISILNRYMNNGTAVKYGQCWVFAGLVTTLCRALGIPCRPVTNFSSPHDADGDLVITLKYDHNGNSLNGPEDDSVWNFHVWNEVWMSRPDLPPGYGRWQVVDATPQCRSGGLYRVGPSPVAATRNGRVDVPYDSRFVYAEVNGELRSYVVDPDTGDFIKRLSDTETAGMLICTKQMGIITDDFADDAEDITSLYKGSKGSMARELEDMSVITLGADVDIMIDNVSSVPLGEPLTMNLILTNNGTDDRNVTVTLAAASVYYNDGTCKDIKRQELLVNLAPGAEEKRTLTITPEEYQEKLAPLNIIRLVVTANVEGSESEGCIKRQRIIVGNPEMKVDVAGPLAVAQSLKYILSFQNPLDFTLTDCRLTVHICGALQAEYTVDVA
ncbi:hemocyte protein-glutamine gamma-glutamyltransferase-like [Ornithodoros turicata]|uniref:hemocyte protein-glutamine gamma-glutamyltransferase-like n=1 Tax=Ornithodoros turicata TaxID=34597 RepID=UPI003139B9D0